MRHIPEDELHAYLDQALSRSQCVEIESHLARCPACQRARDGIAALRDRTTGLLALLAPAPRRPPEWGSLVARARDARARTRRRLWYGGWAASIAAAVAVGWLAHDLSPDDPAGPAPSVATAPLLEGGEAAQPAAEVAPAPATRDAAPDPVQLATTTSREVPRPGPAPAEEAPGPEAGPETEMPAPAAVSLRSADGVLSDFPLSGMWRTLSWDRMQQDSAGWVPRVDGLPVKEIRVSRSSSGGLSVVSQQLASGETIRTVAGPATDVRSIVSGRGGQSASAQLQVGNGLASRADGDRLLVILGDIPADSLRALLMKVR